MNTFVIGLLECHLSNRSRDWNVLHRTFYPISAFNILHFRDHKCLRVEEESKYRRVTCSTLNIRIFTSFRLNRLENLENYSTFKKFCLAHDFAQTKVDV